MIEFFTCPQGHRWQTAADDTSESGQQRSVCPICSSTGSVDAAAATRQTIDELPPRPRPLAEVLPSENGPTIPGYEILAELGRGGMGVVYRARQVNLDRVVALKRVLDETRLGPEGLLRFRSEAEAAARLQHPNIVQIYQVGEEAGLPYFAQEFVDGGSLAQRLAGTPLPVRQAAEIVQTLAEAMHYAHQRGIVHRDLKPANVLLTAGGVPKIADFGLAKRLDKETGQTKVGVILGTPSYMAPEQAQGRTHEITPLTDVYALGAILYETLTGRPPFRAATTLETVRQVLSEEVVAPTRLQPKVPRDLETICLKCLRKEASKRYASAAMLADDLRRFLQSRPIIARRIGWWERAGKWARRRPAAAALLLVCGAAAGTLAIGGYRYERDLERHNRELTAANRAISRERDASAAARDDAEQQRQRALENLVQAAEAVDQMLRRLGFERLARVPKMDQTRAELLEDALRFYDRLLTAQPDDPKLRLVDPALRLMQARTYEQTASIQRQLGRLAQARDRFDKAVALLQELRREIGDPSSAAARTLTRVGLRGTFPGADQKLALTPAGTLAWLLSAAYEERALLSTALGDWKQARADHEATLALYEELLTIQPDEPACHRAIVFSCMNLAIVSHGEKKPDQVKLYLTRARQEAEGLVRQYPDKREYSYLLGWALHHLGVYCFENGQVPQAVPLLEKALEAMRKATDADPGNLEQQAELARCWHNLGWVWLEQGDVNRAAAPIANAVAIRERLAQEHPQVWQFAIELAHGLALLGQLHSAKQEWESAVESLSRALDTLDRSAANPLAAAQARALLRELLPGRSNALIQLKRYSDAVKDLDRAVPLAEGERRTLLRLVRADALVRSGNHARAAEEIEAVLGDPSFPKDGLFNAACIFALAMGQETDPEHAEEYGQRAIQLLTRAQAAGFFKADERHGLLERDPDLSALRGRDDFEALRKKVKG